MQGHGYEGIESWTNVFRDKCEYLLTKGIFETVLLFTKCHLQDLHFKFKAI